MSRPGFVLEVDGGTPPLVVHAGDQLRLERFPLGTRVVYGPDEAATLPDVTGRLADALAAPADAEALPALLRPGMRLTITFDDTCGASPPMAAPDVRQLVIERVLTHAAEAGVDDVALIAAIGLNRRLRPGELAHLLGERVYRSFATTGLLTNHDACDDEALVTLGSTVGGDDVEVSARVAESDLVVHVAVGPTDLGLGLPGTESALPAVPLGVCGARTLRRLAGGAPAAAAAAAADVAGAAGDCAPVAAVAALLADKLPLVSIGVMPDRPGFARPWEFLDKREWEYSLRDRAALAAATRALATTRGRTRARLAPRLRSPHRLTELAVGTPAAVGAKLTAAAAAHRRVQVSGQVDVLVTGVAGYGRFAADSVRNPLQAAHAALRPVFAAEQPWVRAGGVVVVYHPAAHTFSQLYHPSYVDFFDEALAEAAPDGPDALAGLDLDALEQAYADDPWYTHLYRDSYAFHGTHPVLAWRDIRRAAAQLSSVIWVGADRASVARMGFRAASTLADALEIAAATAGSAPSIGYLHDPPTLMPVPR